MYQFKRSACDGAVLLRGARSPRVGVNSFKVCFRPQLLLDEPGGGGSPPATWLNRLSEIGETCKRRAGPKGEGGKHTGAARSLDSAGGGCGGAIMELCCGRRGLIDDDTDRYCMRSGCESGWIRLDTGASKGQCAPLTAGSVLVQSTVNTRQ